MMRYTLMAFAATLLIAADASSDDARLQGTWVLTRHQSDGRADVQGRPATTCEFAGGRWRMTAGASRWSGPYMAEAGVIRLGADAPGKVAHECSYRFVGDRLEFTTAGSPRRVGEYTRLEALTLPGSIRHDDVQYFPPGPEFPWAKTQAARQRERMRASGLGPDEAR